MAASGVVYSILATAAVALHLAFVLFVVGGALLVRKWPRVAWLHIPAAVWGLFVELSGRVCPLTPLENWLRIRAGHAGYEESFLEHYIVAVVYPSGLTREFQVVAGALVILVNVLLYGLLGRQKSRSRNRQKVLDPSENQPSRNTAGGVDAPGVNR